MIAANSRARTIQAAVIGWSTEEGPTTTWETTNVRRCKRFLFDFPFLTFKSKIESTLISLECLQQQRRQLSDAAYQWAELQERMLGEESDNCDNRIRKTDRYQRTDRKQVKITFLFKLYESLCQNVLMCTNWWKSDWLKDLFEISRPSLLQNHV